MKSLSLVTAATPASLLRHSTEATHHAHLHAVLRAAVYMRGHYTEPLCLARLATVAATSRYHFIRIFCARTGVTPLAFVAALRFQQAKHLLTTTNDSVGAICRAVGYASIGSFSDNFTHLVGVRASDFRRLPRPLGSSAPVVASRRTPSLTAGYLQGTLSHAEDGSGPCVLATYPTGIAAGAPLTYTHVAGDGLFTLPQPALPSFYLIAFSTGGSTGAAPEAPGETAGYQCIKINVQPGALDPFISVKLEPAHPTHPPVLWAHELAPIEPALNVA